MTMMRRFLHSLHRRCLASIPLAYGNTRRPSVFLCRAFLSSTTVSDHRTMLEEDPVSSSFKEVEPSNPIVELRGPPEWAVKRALQNEPDAEWDVIVPEEVRENHGHNDVKESFHALIAPDMNEASDDERMVASSSNVNATNTTVESSLSDSNNLEFYDWQWKIVGTSRLLETKMGGWTQDQWYSAESILSSGWPQRHCLRAVVLQFALLRRACQEVQSSSNSTQLPQQQPPSTSQPYSTDTTDNVVGISLQNTGDSSSLPSTPPILSLPERRFGRKMFSRLIDNWRCVYIAYPEILLQLHLGPRDILDDCINIYNGTYEIPLSEKVFRLILAVETQNRYSNSPEFAETVLSHALDLYESGREDCLPTTPLWNSVLLAWVMSNRVQAAHSAVSRIVQLMDELKIARSRQTYRILFRECLQRGTEVAARDAEDLLRQMYKDYLVDPSKVQPDMSTFIYVVDTWAKSNSQLAGPRAEQIYEQMKVLREKQHLLVVGETAETRLVTCVLMCWAIMGTAAAAEKAEAFWRQSGIVPDSAIYSTLINLYNKANCLEDAERIWNEFLEFRGADGMPLKEIEYSASALLSAYSKSNLPNRVELAEALFDRMRDSPHANLDTACYNAFLKVIMTGKNDIAKSRGVDILRKMREECDAGDSRVRPNQISYSTVMNGWAQKGNYERVSEVLRIMYDDFTKGNKDVKPDLYCYNSLMLAHQRSREKDSWARAFALLGHMKKLANAGVLEVQPDVYTVSNALSCLTHSSKDTLTEAAMKATEILNSMRENYESGNSRMSPNAHCYNVVMDVWARQGNPEKAEEIFIQMCNDVRRGNLAAKPQTATYNILLKAWAFSWTPDAVARAEEIIEQMENSATEKPDVRSYTILITCYGRSKEPGSPQKAEKVLEHMDELHQKGVLSEGPNHRTFLSLKRAWEVSYEPNKREALRVLYEKMQARFPNEARLHW